MKKGELLIFLCMPLMCSISIAQFQGPITEIDPCSIFPVPNATWSSSPNLIASECSEVRVGIGTINPTHSLHVQLDARFNQAKIDFNQGIGAEPKGFSKLFIKNTNQDASLEIDQSASNKSYQKLLFFQYSNPTTEILKAQNTVTGITSHLLESNGRMIINNGTVDIFHLDPSGRFTIQNNTRKLFQLETNGLLRVRNVRVDTETWADFVFKKDYNLMPLSLVEQFIKEKGHLPNIPSEEVILEEGINIAEMNVLLMQKIEELTLYLIDQEKQILELKKQVSSINEK